MSNQSLQDIQLAIIPLDGTIFDLNRYRYNYTHHYCESHKLNYSLDDFYQHLSNMYDMYKDTPIQKIMSEGLFNAKVEREMMQYLTYKGLKPKEGFLELLECLHQKNIPVAVLSTHRQKDAQQYLSMCHLTKKVQYIIGSDTVSMSLPSTEILEKILNHFQVKAQNTLVISSFASLNQASYQLGMNIIFCEDLKAAGTFEKETSYKVCHNSFEVLNTLLFDRYNEVDMYSSVLGMHEHMSKEELNQVKEKWEHDYPDDSQLGQIVNQTYAYHISQLNEPFMKDGSVYLNQSSPKKQFHFEDEEQSQETIKSTETKTESLANDSHQKKSSIKLQPQEEDELASLLKQINFKNKDMPSQDKETSADTDLDEEDDDRENEDKQFSFIDILFNFIYIVATSFLIIFIGIVIYIAFIPQFESQSGFFHILSLIFQGYYAIIEACFRVFFDSLHTLIPFIPSYQDYLSHNQMFSLDGVQLFNIFIFQIILLALIKMIIYILRRDSNNENDS